LELEKNVKANLPTIYGNHFPTYITPLIFGIAWRIWLNAPNNPMSDGGNRTHQDNHQLIALFLEEKSN